MILPISKLLEARPLPVCIKSTQTIREALVLMVENDFSQLPVINEGGELLGIISQESIMKRYFHMGGEIPILDLPVNHCQSPVVTLQMGDDISVALAELQKVYAVVIVDESKEKPIGILTDYDIAHFFWGYTQDLLIARNIETNLRMVIQNTFADEDALSAALILTFGKDKDQPGLPRKSMGRLTFGELMRVITHNNNWEKFEDIFGPKEVFEKLMHLARETRNKVAHLEEEISVVQQDALKSVQHWFEYRPSLLKYKQAHIRKSDLETAKKTRVHGTNKYEPLHQYLEGKRLEGESRLNLKFQDVESLLGQELPESARIHRAWWGNHHENIQAASWMKAGWLVDNVNLGDEEVDFRVSRSAYYPILFAGMLSDLKLQRPGITQAKKVGLDNWFSIPSGTSGISFGWVLPREPSLRVDLYIDHPEKEKNKEIFDDLFDQRDEIETRIGETLDWDRLDEHRACRISISRPFLIDNPDEDHEGAKAWGVEIVLKFIDTFRPLISTSGRRKWDEESFFEDVKRRLSDYEVSAVRKVYDAALGYADRIDWGTGMGKGSFNPKVHAISARSLFTMFTDGVLSLNYIWLDDDNTTNYGEQFKKQMLTLKPFRKAIQSSKKFPFVPISDWLPFADELNQRVLEFVSEYQQVDSHPFVIEE